MTFENSEETIGFLSTRPKTQPSLSTGALNALLSPQDYFKHFPRKTIKRCLLRGARLTLICLLIGVGLFCTCSVALLLLGHSYSSLPQTYRDFAQQAQLTGKANPNDERVFIAANIINADLIRGEWGKSLMRLVDLIGPENAFVSIYENDSGIDTKSALEELRLELPCNRSVVTGAHIDLHKFRQLTMASGETVIRRIEYLAEVRNRVLRPLDEMQYQENEDVQNGLTFAKGSFDRVLFINDVFFDPLEASQLLFSTNQGQYDAACSVDFKSGTNFYDDFATRDADGRELGYGPGFRIFPWFAAYGVGGKSRSDVLAGKDAVEVKSCWGGMVSFQAEFFQQRYSASNDSVVRFRSESELYWEASECCLIHADIASLRKQISADDNQALGIYINPYVRVAYTRTTFRWIWTIARFERGFIPLQWLLTLVFRYPEYNERRASIAGQEVTEKVWIGSDITSGHFEDVRRPAAGDGYCGKSGVQLLKPRFQEAVAKGERSFIHLDAPK